MVQPLSLFLEMDGNRLAVLPLHTKDVERIEVVVGPCRHLLRVAIDGGDQLLHRLLRQVVLPRHIDRRRAVGGLEQLLLQLRDLPHPE